MTDGTSQPLTMFWDLPVLANGRLIFGPLAAKTFMAEKWSTSRNSDFAPADLSIVKALTGRGSPDHARELFAKAVESARLT